MHATNTGALPSALAMGDNWLETDYETEGMLALEMTAEQLSHVLDDPYRWKWVVIALHNALQAFLVHSCSGTDLLGAMTTKYQRQWREAYDRGEILDREGRLAPVGELVERARSLRGYIYMTPLPPNDEQDTAVMKLGSWRDTFVHYKPMGLTIEISGFPAIFRPCLDVIEFLAFESGHVWTDQADHANRTQGALEQIRAYLDETGRSYSR